MAFQVKNFVSIVASMINLVRTRSDTLTDFNVGSVNRTLIEAPAQEIDELYQQMVAGLVAAVPVATYRTFSFGKLSAAAAGGLVRVSITPQASLVKVAAGTTVTQSLSPSVYVSTADATIAPGDSYVDVPVVATVPGVAGNLPASTSFALSVPPPGFSGATNLVAFINGTDDETDAQQKARFNSFVSTLARGTLAALVFGAVDKSFLTDANGNVTERVAFASTHEPWLTDNTQPVGYVQMYLHNGSGGTSGALVARTAQVLYGYVDPLTGLRVPGYKAAGVKVDVAAATEVAVSLTAVIAAAFGYSSDALAARARTVVAAYIAALDIGQSFLIARVTELIMEIPGVSNVTYSGSPADRTATFAQKFMPGTLAFTGG